MERKRSQENVEKQKGWRLVEMKEDGSDFCFVLFVCLFFKWCNFVLRERERERRSGGGAGVFLFRVRGRPRLTRFGSEYLLVFCCSSYFGIAGAIFERSFYSDQTKRERIEDVFLSSGAVLILYMPS